MDKATEKLIKKIAPGALAAIQATNVTLIARADELRSELRERYPDYESLLAAAAGHISAIRDRELLIRSTINFPDLSLEDKLSFIEALHPDAATVLKNTIKTKTAANGSSGGKKRSAKYQELRAEIITAYLASPEAQAQKTIKGAVRILTRNNPQFEPSERMVHDLISAERKIAK